MSDALFDLAVRKLGTLEEPRLAPACKICDSEAYPFDILDFNKSTNKSLYPTGLRGIPIIYWMCSQCQFIFTDLFDEFTDDQWRHYVYNDEYVRFDPDYVDIRPRLAAEQLAALLSGQRKRVIGLDYGGRQRHGRGPAAAEGLGLRLL